MSTKQMTRAAAIEILISTTLDEDVGVGHYRASAAYKLVNGDINASTEGLSEEIRAAIDAAGVVDWGDIDPDNFDD